MRYLRPPQISDAVQSSTTSTGHSDHEQPEGDPIYDRTLGRPSGRLVALALAAVLGVTGLVALWHLETGASTSATLRTAHRSA